MTYPKLWTEGQSCDSNPDLILNFRVLYIFRGAGWTSDPTQAGQMLYYSRVSFLFACFIFRNGLTDLPRLALNLLI